MTNDNEAPGPGSTKISKEIPEFMDEEGRKHIRASMLDYRELWIDAATFDSLRDKDWEDRLTLVGMVKEVLDTHSTAQWSDAVGSTHLIFGSVQDTGPENDKDKLARSFYLRTALMHVLDIADAPRSFKDDIAHWLNHKMPRIASKRGSVQAVLIDHPELAEDPASLAAKAKCSRRLVDRYLEDGSVQRMP